MKLYLTARGLFFAGRVSDLVALLRSQAASFGPGTVASFIKSRLQ